MIFHNYFLKHNSVKKRNWLVRRIHDEALFEVTRKYLCGTVIDIGCGEKPYATMIEPYVAWYIGVDHPNTEHNKENIDYFASAYNLAIADKSVDSVICTAVLEHLEEPARAVREAFRVLKKGGVAIYSVPFFWHLHEEPRDFYRFTKYGLKYLFENIGFEIVELKALSGFWVTFGQELVYYFWRFRKGGKLNPLWWIIPIIGMLIQCVSYFLNKIDKSKQFSWMHLLVGKKI